MNTLHNKLVIAALLSIIAFLVLYIYNTREKKSAIDYQKIRCDLDSAFVLVENAKTLEQKKVQYEKVKTFLTEKNKEIKKSDKEVVFVADSLNPIFNQYTAKLLNYQAEFKALEIEAFVAGTKFKLSDVYQLSDTADTIQARLGKYGKQNQKLTDAQNKLTEFSYYCEKVNEYIKIISSDEATTKTVKEVEDNTEGFDGKVNESKLSEQQKEMLKKYSKLAYNKRVFLNPSNNISQAEDVFEYIFNLPNSKGIGVALKMFWDHAIHESIEPRKR